MILFADSGSSKCDWVIYNNVTNELSRTRTKGLNPNILTEKKITNIIRKSNELFAIRNIVEKVYFYGAGCGTIKNQEKVIEVLKLTFQNAITINVKEDLMAAVLATTNEPAIICILGTGSNCCYYDGEHIQTKIPSLGYVLMDEASGNYFGKELLKSYYYNQLPNELRVSFEQSYKLNPQKVLDKIYKSKYPNKYLANFARFLIYNIEHPYIVSMIRNGMRVFIQNHILPYSKEYINAPIHFVGSIAYHIQEIINEELASFDLSAKSFVRRPIQNVIDNILQAQIIVNN
ncbi:N-acetylglucosamine kinase [Tenacibaculum sp. SZ-18]|uniref:N-acetylglucosamine kinase n=1 Tax=Tenacibaculum sp. SZ-18 TaxID=754423 RepID=UPI000C2CE657|nr:N-acetylglucosamine kinase [Tenacibaculum sp. SZ-18]AUC13887.1 N-acetylglucosamine kinase [Tenacibaculum sp. SZ-18]